MKNLKLFEEFNGRNIKKIKDITKRKKQIEVIDYVINFLSKKNRISNDDYNTLHGNLDGFWIFDGGGLGKLLKILVVNESDNFIEILKKYKSLYIQWLEHNDWWIWYFNYSVEEDYDGDIDSATTWKYYNKMKKFIRNVKTAVPSESDTIKSSNTIRNKTVGNDWIEDTSTFDSYKYKINMNNLKTFEEINHPLKKNDRSIGGDNQIVRNIMNKIESSFNINKISDTVLDFCGGEDEEIVVCAYTIGSDKIYSYGGKVYINNDRLDVTKDLARELESFLIQKVENYEKYVVSNRYNNYRSKYGNNVPAPSSSSNSEIRRKTIK